MRNIIKTYESDECYPTCKMLLSLYSIQSIEAAVVTYYIGKGYGLGDRDILNVVKSSSINCSPALEKLVEFSEEQGEGMKKELLFIYQYLFQMERWKKSKQAYIFNADFVKELAGTDTKSISVPYNVFDRMPHKSVFLDYSSNEELCRQIGFDGALVQVQGVEDEQKDAESWVLFALLYRKDGNVMAISQHIPNEEKRSEINVEEATEGISKEIQTESGTEIIEGKPIFALILQSLLYLCSYEPDIRESMVSKQRYRNAKSKAKKNKNGNSPLPEREYKVGERFGEAFRKWTKGCLGQSSGSTGTGSKKRPHLRRAHWHRYWIGKRDSEERELIIRWVSECFCGFNEDETEIKLDVVSHNVKK